MEEIEQNSAPETLTNVILVLEPTSNVKPGELHLRRFWRGSQYQGKFETVEEKKCAIATEKM